MGVSAEPTLAAMAERVTARATFTPAISEVATTSGTKISMVVSFMITVEESEIVRIKSSMRRLSEWLADFINRGASFEKTPDSSSPLEAIINAVITERLSQSISSGVLRGKLESTTLRVK